MMIDSCLSQSDRRSARCHGVCAGHPKHYDNSPTTNIYDDIAHRRDDGNSVRRIHDSHAAMAENKVGRRLS